MLPIGNIAQATGRPQRSRVAQIRSLRRGGPQRRQSARRTPTVSSAPPGRSGSSCYTTAAPDARSAAEDRADSGRDFFTEVEAALPKVALPDHTTVIVEGAGTYVESDAPDEFAAAVRAFSAGGERPSE
ncbi:hypothetical protein MPHO_39790 [Mycolicibacterium phocaicum]|nr:hypothetical protein MPHO_39790 [Mycolicibacterium phocaicum]